MANSSLAGCRILIVEDEYLVAATLAEELADEAATVVGPAPSVQRALALIEGELDLHLAVLDINLGGEAVYPVADVLAERGVPFLLVTGYDPCAIPERYRGFRILQKPIEMPAVVAAVRQVLA